MKPWCFFIHRSHIPDGAVALVLLACTLCGETGLRDAATQRAEQAEFDRQDATAKDDGIPF